MYEETIGIIIVRVLLSAFIPAIVAIIGYYSTHEGGYRNIYKPGNLVEEISFNLL